MASKSRANPGTSYTVVSDSESDICEIFAEVGDLPKNCHFVIWGYQYRGVLNCGDAANVDEALEIADVQFTTEATISDRASTIVRETSPRRKSGPARIAKICVRARNHNTRRLSRTQVRRVTWMAKRMARLQKIAVATWRNENSGGDLNSKNLGTVKAARPGRLGDRLPTVKPVTTQLIVV